ncbi:uncharacterized protein LOC110465241 [Mizuhopecten yessoensis]|uniref:DUF229 domain containing protein n=1 Tax=Mizuhopecten yessoensis TaxID=6573 RepID=A0A210PRZ1_MIZYE|nr:uncharacterized protein LOC110465241 [Mizuhopecten yessoensis]OWF39263.1 hypothetical protein KP79_PYT20731 [Mizuhopecten yessoensis]
MKVLRTGPRYLGLYGIRSTKKLIGLMFLGGFFMVYGYFKYFQEPLYVFMHNDIHSECILPDIDPNDPTIMKFYNWHPPPLVCDPTSTLTVVDDSGFLRFNESVYNPSKTGKLDCVYSIVNLVNDFKVKFEVEVAFDGPVNVPADAFVVRCRSPGGKIVYENIHQKIDRKSREKTRVIKDETDEDFSVLMFGIDSVSRLAAIRKLPKTVKYITETLGGYMFKGYNKVGDHTFPNLLALLTGKTQFGHKHVNIDTDYADNYPFIWYDFEKNGYATMHGEDWPEIATINQVMKMGFDKPPTTHYSRAYWLAMRKIQPMQYTIDQVFMFLESKAMKLRKSSALCYGNRPNHMLIVDYFKQFVHAYKGKRKFAFTWLNELAHNYVNFLEYGDNDFMEFIKWMHVEGHLDKTVLLFFSDHGSRVDEIRNTYVGRIEDRMPFVSIVIPDVLKKKYPAIAENLRANEERLTTTFDTYEAIRDVLHKRYNNLTSNVRANNRAPRAVSIFRRIPKVRSCADAMIPEHYCACFSSQPINKTDPVLKTIADFVLQSINNLLHPVRNRCAKLSLGEIMEARIVTNNLERKADKELKFTLRNWISTPEKQDDKKYLIFLRTTPGNATFESSVVRTTDGRLKIIDDISRTNRYGTQSKCVADRFLKGYCFCTIDEVETVI